MKIHEYQAKAIFRNFDLAVPRGKPAFSKNEALAVAAELGYPCVIKAQIHAGGRGKGGGVKLVKNNAEAIAAVDAILGQRLVTAQTGKAGKIVRRLLIEEAVRIDREFYTSIIIDRQKAAPVLIVSTEGGMEIEKIALKMPEKIIKEYAIPGFGFEMFQLRRVACRLTSDRNLLNRFVDFFARLYTIFCASDASLVEINPLVTTEDGQVIALDAKINLDDNAAYRHPERAELRDPSEEDEAEIEASKYKLNYIRLDGNVGCMVNGAGLAMATMDLIKLQEGKPANFLDVGGVASPHTIANGFRVLSSDPNVKAILINIFGGIVRCDRVALGILEALETVRVQVPVVIRLEGTNAELARKILGESSLDFKVANTFKEAAQMAVAATIS